ncbi:conditioned medium-induced protein 4 [Haloarculaceae archaeon H-GB2-1]|nr:conditioned medium-induced protein 4 [Haloarculaceae archaeon H-GB1-1]MEA5407025.1 conditioned medium-induced protein 4 [Haloarculaceae archaeon H-GB2-1]
MDDKTESLRDIFMDVSEEGTVTESQEAERGTLTDVDDATVEERLTDVVERMADRYDFDAGLSTDEYCEVVRRFYDGDSDAEIAAAVESSEATVFRARTDCHLLRESDLDGPVEPDAVRDRLDEDPDELAADLGVDSDELRPYRRALAARTESMTDSHRFQDEFEEILTDADISGTLTEGVREDGLREATEDIETDVSF